MKNRLVLLLFLLSFNLFAQEEPAKIYLMNGKVLEVYDLNDSTLTVLQYKYDKNYFKKERLRLKYARSQDLPYSLSLKAPKADTIPVVLREGEMDRDEAFSVVYPSGDEKFYYFYDEPFGNYLEVEEMRAFLAGERDARFALSGKKWFYSGMVVGAIGGYALRQSVFTLAVPPLFALSAKIPVIKIKEEYIRDKSYQYNENYASGFEARARTKNTIEALKGSAIGTAIGLLTYTIVQNNQ